MKSDKKQKTIYEAFFKRFFDVTLSCLALVVASPVFLITYVCSKISLGGKTIFFQYRPGKTGKLFKLYKFRSMTNETDKNGNLLPDKDRLTRFGKIIRKLSLDELPQLVNIIKGDMSIVGPRPRMVKDVIFYSEEALKSFCVRPGLTGQSQISGGRSGSSWEEIFACDNSYAQKITFWKDLSILFKTVFALFRFEGSADGMSEREYFYCNHLLKNNLITPEQYALGLSLAQDLIENKLPVTFQPALHKECPNSEIVTTTMQNEKSTQNGNLKQAPYISTTNIKDVNNLDLNLK